MTENHDLLRRIMREGVYQGTADEKRIQLCGVYRDDVSVREAFERGASFRISFFLEVGDLQYPINPRDSRGLRMKSEFCPSETRADGGPTRPPQSAARIFYHIPA